MLVWEINKTVVLISISSSRIVAESLIIHGKITQKNIVHRKQWHTQCVFLSWEYQYTALESVWKFRTTAWSCVCESRSNKKDRVESSSRFLLVKQSLWTHKSMCVFFSSLNTCWSLWIHVLFQALSLLMSALYCGQSAFPPCLHTHN